MSLNHQHFMVDCFVHKPLCDVDKTIDFLKRLVAAIEMKIVAGPISAYCDADGNNGITGAVCVQTSHCSIHVWDKVEKPYMRLDVYSCKAFNDQTVLDLIEEFEPYSILTHNIDRNPWFEGELNTKELLTPRDDMFVVRNFLTREECWELIGRAEATGFQISTINTAAGAMVNKNMRDNERIIVDDILLADRLWGKFKRFAPEKYGCQPIGLNTRFRIYRYEPGQFFDWHFDGHFEKNHQERSMLTFMIYLNGCEGGTTEFTFKTGVVRDEDAEIVVKPEQGMTLVFPHNTFHRGAPVTAGKKYVLRSDVMYRV